MLTPIETRLSLPSKIYELARKQDASPLVVAAACQIQNGQNPVAVACSLMEAQEVHIRHLFKIAQGALHNRPPAPIVFQVSQSEADRILQSIPHEEED